MSKRVFKKFTNKRLKSLLNYIVTLKSKTNCEYKIILKNETDNVLCVTPIISSIEEYMKQYLEYQVVDYMLNYQNLSYYITIKPGNKEPFAKGLTKEELLEYGFVDAYKDDNGWHIIRNWYYKNKKEKRYKECKLSYDTKPHPYGKDMTYIHVNCRYKGRGLCFQLARFLYAWFVEDIPDGYDIDHIDNNPLNNDLDNLRMLTHKENVRRREGQCFNQYKNSVKQ